MYYTWLQGEQIASNYANFMTFPLAAIIQTTNANVKTNPYPTLAVTPNQTLTLPQTKNTIALTSTLCHHRYYSMKNCHS